MSRTCREMGKLLRRILRRYPLASNCVTQFVRAFLLYILRYPLSGPSRVLAQRICNTGYQAIVASRRILLAAALCFAHSALGASFTVNAVLFVSSLFETPIKLRFLLCRRLRCLYSLYATCEYVARSWRECANCCEVCAARDV